MEPAEGARLPSADGCEGANDEPWYPAVHAASEMRSASARPATLGLVNKSTLFFFSETVVAMDGTNGSEGVNARHPLKTSRARARTLPSHPCSVCVRASGSFLDNRSPISERMEAPHLWLDRPALQCYAGDVKTIGIFEAKNRLSELVAEVERGETVLLTRNGHPVAELVPTKTDGVKAASAMKWIRSRRWKLKGLSIRELIDEGRRL